MAPVEMLNLLFFLQRWQYTGLFWCYDYNK